MPPGPGARKSSSRKRKNTSEETPPDKKAKRVATAEEPEAQRKLSRLQRIITGEKSKAALMKRAVRNPAKAKKQTSSRLTGKLTLMLQIPVDVFCEIAAHLSPLDLLHMARSTRPLRDMLMSKRSRPVWRSALGELNTPDCPPEISEPRFMSLIFERFCYGCGAPCTNKVDYGFRVRLCRGCFNLNVVFGSKLVKELNHKASKNDVIYGLCCSYKGYDTLAVRQRRKHLKRHMFFRPDFLDALRQYLSYDSGSDDQRSFLEDRKRIVKETNAHAIKVANWLALKKKTDGQTVCSRKSCILNRLRELGYTELDFQKNGIDREYRNHRESWDELIYQPHELTEKIWKAILPQLKKIIRLRRKRGA